MNVLCVGQVIVDNKDRRISVCSIKWETITCLILLYIVFMLQILDIFLYRFILKAVKGILYVEKKPHFLLIGS